MMNGNNDEIIKQIQSKVVLENIKSNFILKKIYDNIKKDKPLKIMKYNKKLQKRLNLSIESYKEYSQSYSSIEIELLVTNDINNRYIKFINISNKEKDSYHIYFNNSNEEKKRYSLQPNENVKNINNN